MAPDRRHAPRCGVLGRADMTRYRRSLRPSLATRAACHPPWPPPGQAPDVPEGDALRRAAQRLQVLVGQRVEAEAPHPRTASSGLAERLDGRRLEAVEAVGKNLL